MSPQLMADYGRSCGEVLARAHARTGDRIAKGGYLGRGEAAEDAFVRFAEAYADGISAITRRCARPLWIIA